MGSCQAQREGQGALQGSVHTAINLSLLPLAWKQQGSGNARNCSHWKGDISAVADN